MNNFSQNLISEIKEHSKKLNILYNISIKYHNQSIPHNLSKSTLYYIELIHYNLSLVLQNFYSFDLDHGALSNPKLSQSEIDLIVSSPFALYQYQKFKKDFDFYTDKTDLALYELESIFNFFNRLLDISEKYSNIKLINVIDKKVFFYIEQIHESISSILTHLYSGDLFTEYLSDKISLETLHQIGKSTFADYQYSSYKYLYNETFIENFSTQDKYFNFNLSGSCFLYKSGRCSLNFSDYETTEYINNDYNKNYNKNYTFEQYKRYFLNSKSDSICYCRNLKSNILKNGYKDPITISQHYCNHYSFNDGQHRACIASILNISLPALVSYIPEDEGKCFHCKESFKNINLINQQNNTNIISLLNKLFNKKPLYATIPTNPPISNSLDFRKL